MHERPRRSVESNTKTLMILTVTHPRQGLGNQLSSVRPTRQRRERVRDRQPNTKTLCSPLFKGRGGLLPLAERGVRGESGVYDRMIVTLTRDK
jgi:hypothetical protein